jgi:hypothetical protein
VKVILFDLGNTLEDHGILLPGAVQMLTALAALRDAQGQPLGLGVVSDFDMPHIPADVPAIRQQYIAILERLGIRSFFDPVERGVTLSTEVGVFKPHARVFRAALNKFQRALPFGSALFVTEDSAHVAAANALGVRAVHLKGPGQSGGEIADLLDLIPLVQEFILPRPLPIRVGSAVESWSARMERSAASWARFGDDIFVFGASDVLRQVRRADRVQPSAEVPRDHLHLVVQKGRLFQKAFPNVPVLLDRGRFVVVELDPAIAAQISKNDEPCYAIRPLADQHIVFDTRAPQTARVAEVPWVRALVDGIVRAPFESDLTHLVSFPTRHSTSASYLEAATWAAAQFDGMGYQVDQRVIDVGGSASRNVIAERPGSGATPRGVVLVTAHLDSVNHDAGGGPVVPAPGADDNATGSAGVLQIARSLRNHSASENLRFILFGGEEQGLFGSRQYVSALSPTERGEIRAVVNMDMIGCLNQEPRSVLIEGSAVSQDVLDSLVEAAATYTTLVVETSLQPFASDHVSFIDADIPAVLTIEGADQANAHDHTPHDVIANINYDIALEIVRMNLAFVALKLGRIEV